MRSATQRLLSGDQRGEVLDLVTLQALGISGADLVVLALPAGDRRQLVIEHACGDGAAAALGLVLPAEGSASGIVMASGKPLTIRRLQPRPTGRHGSPPAHGPRPRGARPARPRVRDNGVGLPETTRRSGLGNLADRAGELDGTFHVGPADGGGTELEWRVSLLADDSPGP